jgi:galactokinase
MKLQPPLTQQRLMRCIQTLGGARGRMVAYYVPGRIEILGKHTDYAGGRSIVAAAEQGFAIVAMPRADRLVRVTDLRAHTPVQFQLHPELQPAPGNWGNYPMTVARRIARNFPGGLRGADIVFDSDLPPAAGMSSSSALMIACFLVLSDVNDLPQRSEYQQNIHSREELAAYLATIENGQSFRGLEGDHGVGTFGGSEDHTAVLCAKRGHLSQFGFCPVRHERDIPQADDLVFAIASSGVLAEKTRAAREKYNLISQRARTIVQVWREHGGRDETLAAAVRSSPGAVDTLRTLLREHVPQGFTSDELILRLDQFVEESEQIIPAFGDALVDGRLGDLGTLADRSQCLAESHLGNQVPQTRTLVHEARDLGAIAASAFGAGFGGSVWALVRESESDAFLDRWLDSYRERHPDTAPRARFFTTHPGPGATRLDLDSHAMP